MVRLASLPFAPVDSDVKTLAHLSLHLDAKRQKPTVFANSGTAVVFIIAEYYNTYMPTERQKISGARAAEIRKITGMLKLELNIIHLN